MCKRQKKSRCNHNKKSLELLNEIDKLNNDFDAIFKQINKKEAKIINDLLDKIRG